LGNKINHHAKPGVSKAVIGWQSILRDFLLGIICTMMAIFGWNSSMLLLAVPTGFVAVMCYCSALLSIGVQLNENRKYRKKQ
jgi:hypothetical protein